MKSIRWSLIDYLLLRPFVARATFTASIAPCAIERIRNQVSFAIFAIEVSFQEMKWPIPIAEDRPVS